MWVTWCGAQAPVASSVHPFQLEVDETWQIALRFGARESRTRAHPYKAKENPCVTVPCIFTALTPELMS